MFILGDFCSKDVVQFWLLLVVLLGYACMAMFSWRYPDKHMNWEMKEKEWKVNLNGRKTEPFDALMVFRILFLRWPLGCRFPQKDHSGLGTSTNTAGAGGLCMGQLWQFCHCDGQVQPHVPGKSRLSQEVEFCSFEWLNFKAKSFCWDKLEGICRSCTLSFYCYS